MHYITKPPVFDTNAVIQSAENMKTALVNIGYYHPEVTYTFDTVMHRKAQKRIITNYSVIAGKRTLVDTLAYLFENPELEELALATKKESPLAKKFPCYKKCYTAGIRKTC